MEQLDRNRDEGSPANDPSDLAEPPADVMFDPATEKPSSAPVDDFQAEFEKLAQHGPGMAGPFCANQPAGAAGAGGGGAAAVHV